VCGKTPAQKQNALFGSMPCGGSVKTIIGPIISPPEIFHIFVGKSKTT